MTEYAITLGEIMEWAMYVNVLKKGDVGKNVVALQQALDLIDHGLYTGRVDGDFGKLTETAVLRFQQFRSMIEDGEVGPMTKAAIMEAVMLRWSPGGQFQHPTFPIEVTGALHPRLGLIPGAVLGSYDFGKISCFGGPDDKHDRVYGQAYIRSSDTPAKLAEDQQELMKMGIFRPDIVSFDQFPMTTDYKGRMKRAGTSWALNPDSFYIAMRWEITGRSIGYMDSGNPRLLVWSETTQRAVVCLRTDYGPHPRAGRLMDLSPGAMNHLGLETDDRAYVCWARDDAPIGPVAGA